MFVWSLAKLKPLTLTLTHLAYPADALQEEGARGIMSGHYGYGERPDNPSVHELARKKKAAGSRVMARCN